MAEGSSPSMQRQFGRFGVFEKPSEFTFQAVSLVMKGRSSRAAAAAEEQHLLNGAAWSGQSSWPQLQDVSLALKR